MWLYRCNIHRDGYLADINRAVQINQRLKGKGKAPTFLRAAKRACGYVIDICGDKPLPGYTKANADAVGPPLKLVAFEVRIFTTRYAAPCLYAQKTWDPAANVTHHAARVFNQQPPKLYVA